MRELLIKKMRGDTLIEVAFSIAIFCLIAAITMIIMNSDLASMQATLELTMARNEMDSQSEAIRFIHNNYLSERELVLDERPYQELWLKLTRNDTETVSTSAGQGLVNDPSTVSKFYSTECSNYYDDSVTSGDIHSILTDHAFILNTRKIRYDSTSGVRDTIISTRDASKRDLFQPTTLYPRVIYTTSSSSDGNSDDNLNEAGIPRLYDQVARVEGLWVIGIKQKTTGSAKPQYYDFHVRACWNAPGKSQPSTIATIIRLYNPEYIEESI